jgi:hypothetical protein
MGVSSSKGFTLFHKNDQKDKGTEGGNAYGGYVEHLSSFDRSNVAGGSTHHSHKHVNTDDLSTFKEYEKTYASKAKEDTIRKMANAMKKVGMNLNPDDDLDKIITDLNREIPNPKKGKTFAADAKTQEKVCRIVAGVLNDEFTPGAPEHERFIDLSMSPIEICRAVGEYTHSFNQGVNTEFLGVIGSVKNSLHAMNMMDQVMAELYKKIQENIGKAKDDILEREIKPLNDIYIRATQERDQKKKVLENLLHVHLEPTSKALQEALREHGNDVSLVKKLGLRLGSTDFANAIAAALSGLGSTASIANKVHKALKTVGLSMNEYLNSPSFREFENKLDAIVDEGKLNDDDLVKFLIATKSLREGFDYRKDAKFKEIVTRGGRPDSIKMGGGHSHKSEGGRRNHYSSLDDNLSSLDTDVFGNNMKSSIRRRASKVMAKKELISKDFVIRLDRHYNELLDAMKDIAVNMGKTIPLTSKTELLRDALMHLQESSQNTEIETASDEMTIELIVSRGLDTVEARRRKEQYINRLRMIADICEIITGMEAYRSTSSKFSKVKDIVGKIEKTIDYFSKITSTNKNSMSDVGTYDRMYEKEINDPAVSSSKQIKNSESSYNSDDEYTNAVGGSTFEYKELDIPQIAKTGLTLNEIINTFNYYYYLAGVRNNLKISSKEYNLYGEDYSNMLGNSIAKRLYELEKKYKMDLKQLHEDTPKFELDAVAKRVLNDATKARIMKWIDSEYEIKVKFYKALQALDLYLKEFTPAITSNVDAVKEIKSMLDETQVIARWFNESTGNSLVDAFEQLPGFNLHGVNTYSYSDNKDTGDDATTVPTIGMSRDHYYTKINNIMSTRDIKLGNPIFGCSFVEDVYEKNTEEDSKIFKMKKHVDDSIDHFQALKNIVNTFIRIGN